MKPWTRPQNYIGANWHGWLAFLSRNRDSSLLENHNFEVALATLIPLSVDVADNGDDLSGVQVVSENHFLCGWIEWIAIHESNAAAIQAAELLEAKLENYPILSEMEYSHKLHSAYRGEDVSGYIDPNREDELVRLEKLIEAAREITL